jgi:hypothetical protein
MSYGGSPKKQNEDEMENEKRETIEGTGREGGKMYYTETEQHENECMNGRKEEGNNMTREEKFRQKKGGKNYLYF